MGRENWVEVDTFKNIYELLSYVFSQDKPSEMIGRLSSKIPELEKMKKINENGISLYEHTLSVVDECQDITTRFIGFFHDFGKIRTLLDFIDYELYSMDSIIKYLNSCNLIEYTLPIRFHVKLFKAMEGELSVSEWKNKFKLYDTRDLIRFGIYHEKSLGHRVNCQKLTELLDGIENEIKIKAKGEVMT